MIFFIDKIKIISNISANFDTLPRSNTASYTSVNFATLSSVTTNEGWEVDQQILILILMNQFRSS